MNIQNKFLEKIDKAMEEKKADLILWEKVKIEVLALESQLADSGKLLEKCIEVLQGVSDFDTYHHDAVELVSEIQHFKNNVS